MEFLLICYTYSILREFPSCFSRKPVNKSRSCFVEGRGAAKMGCFVRGFSSSSSLIIGRHSPLFAAVVSVYIQPGTKGRRGRGKPNFVEAVDDDEAASTQPRERLGGGGGGGGVEATATAYSQSFFLLPPSLLFSAKVLLSFPFAREVSCCPSPAYSPSLKCSRLSFYPSAHCLLHCSMESAADKRHHKQPSWLEDGERVVVS